MEGTDLYLKQADCRDFIGSLPDNSIQCIICDPPFGLGEEGFDKHYNRDSKFVLDGYSAAPTGFNEYQEWSKTWISQIPRVLKDNGTFYVICSWNHVCDVELAVRSVGLHVLNHIIWKYGFGVYTQKKFVSSHYHILRCGKMVTPAFYNRAYFSEMEKTSSGGSAQYQDMEDVWVINKEYSPGETKNINKLPDKLVEKMIFYSSKPGDWVADFFLGNFTTAYVSRRTGRRFVGCEINPMAFNKHSVLVPAIELDLDYPGQKPSTKPVNSGKKISDDERDKILERYDEIRKSRAKKDTISELVLEFGRGQFSLSKLLKTNGR